MVRCRALIVAGFVAVLLGLLTGTAAAIPTIPIPGGDQGLLQSKLCPPKNAPVPEMPEDGLPPGDGDYQKFGYAGLYWTTYDQSCLSTAKLDNGTGNLVNDAGTAVDGLVNQAQSYALDPHFTDPLRRVVDDATPQLRDTFFYPWLRGGLAGAGVMLLFAFLLGRETEVFRVTLNVFVVLGAVFFVLAAPGRISQMSADATAGVAADGGRALAGYAGTPIANTSQAFTDGYYQMSYRAWADGAFCYNHAASGRWASRIRNDQAYTVDEKRRIEVDPKAATGIKDGKQKDWVKAADEMKQKDPAAYDCWSGATSSRFKSGSRHFLVSILAGIWVLLCAFGLLILQDMLMFGILLLVGIGAVLLALRRAADRMFEFLILAAVGAPFVALVMTVLLTGFFVILSDPALPWLSSMILAVSLGAAIWLSRPFLRRMFAGMAAVDMGRKAGRKTLSMAKLGAGGVFIPAAAGAALGEAAARRMSPHHRRAKSGDDRSAQPDPADLIPTRDRAPGRGKAPSGDDRNLPIPVQSGSVDLTHPKRPGPAPGEPAGDSGAAAAAAAILTAERAPVDGDDPQPEPMPEASRPSPEAGPRHRSGLTRDEENAWHDMASRELERFGHPPTSRPDPRDLYRPPPISGDDARSETPHGE